MPGDEEVDDRLKGPEPTKFLNKKRRTPHAYVQIGSVSHCPMLDTGAEVSIISVSLFERVKKHARNVFWHPAGAIKTLSGTGPSVYGVCTLPIKFKKETFWYEFFIVSDNIQDMIIGIDFLVDQGALFDLSKLTLKIGSDFVLLKYKDDITEIHTLARTIESHLLCPYSISYIKLALDSNYNHHCIVIPQSNAPSIIDQPGLTVPNILTKPSQGYVIIPIYNNTGAFIKIKNAEALAVVESLDSPQINYIQQVDILDDTVEEESQEFKMDNNDPIIQDKLKKLLHQYSFLVAHSDKELGSTDLVKLKINTGDHPPIRQRPYRIPLAKQGEINDQLGEMLAARVIRPSTSPWASPLVMVPKKDGTTRICIDFRKLNRVMVQNSYPLPNIEDIFSRLGKSKYFSSLDLRSGYWQIEVDEADKCKTAFVTHEALFEFNRMPFGLSSSPSIFQELMNKVLEGINNRYAMAYLDDVVIYSETVDEHLEHLRDVLDRLSRAGLKIKPSKCVFFKKELKYLGHIISGDGLRPDEEKVSAIKDLSPPRSVKDVRSFLGCASYYRKFINSFADIAKPLTKLTKKNAHFVWGQEAQESFDFLKDALIHAPVLAFPDMELPFHVYTDASDKAVGAVLTQKFVEGERPIQYLSHQLNDGQKKWPIIQREAYAIVYALIRLRHYLFGAKFTIYCDHKPLHHLFTSEMKNPRIQRWAIMLDEYKPNIEYHPGRKNVNGDFMSRLWTLPVNPEVNILNTDKITDKSLDMVSEEEQDDNVEALSPEQIVEELKVHKVRYYQKKDEALGQIMVRLEASSLLPGDEEYVLENNTLYHVSQPTKKDPLPRLQLVIPEKIQQIVMEACHENCGHLMLERTYDKIRKRYFWSGMYRDVVLHCQKCQVCTQRRIRKKRSEIQGMPQAEYPFQIVGIDTCGPYNETTEGGNRYIITLVDHFSGYPECIATPDKSADTVAHFLLTEVIPRHTCPSLLVSDRGTEYCNSVISALSSVLNVSHIRTSPYHPQSNGKTERFHRVMNDMLAKMVEANKRDWDVVLPLALMAYRVSYNETTNQTPFFLVHGRDPVLPLDTLLEPKTPYYGDEYLPTMLQKLSKAFTLAKQCCREAHERNREYVSRSSENIVYQVGDAVYYHDKTLAKGQSSKLQCPWKPFFRIIEVLSPVNVRIRHQGTGVTKVVHTGNIHPAHPEADWDLVQEVPRHVLAKSRGQEDAPLKLQPMRKARIANNDDEEFIGGGAPPHDEWQRPPAPPRRDRSGDPTEPPQGVLRDETEAGDEPTQMGDAPLVRPPPRYNLRSRHAASARGTQPDALDQYSSAGKRGTDSAESGPSPKRAHLSIDSFLIDDVLDLFRDFLFGGL